MRADDAGWREFEGWCRARRLRPLPAHPWTLAAFVRWCETRYAYPLVVQRVRAVARRHILECFRAPDRDPLVQRTLRTVERRQRARSQRAALFPEPQVATRGAPRGKRPPRQRRRRTFSAIPRLVSRRPEEA